MDCCLSAADLAIAGIYAASANRTEWLGSGCYGSDWLRRQPVRTVPPSARRVLAPQLHVASALLRSVSRPLPASAIGGNPSLRCSANGTQATTDTTNRQ